MDKPRPLCALRQRKPEETYRIIVAAEADGFTARVERTDGVGGYFVVAKAPGGAPEVFPTRALAEALARQQVARWIAPSPSQDRT